MSVVILLVGVIGCSWVYLGVYWLSDVLVGWSFGMLWVFGWWLVIVCVCVVIGGEC